MNRHLIWVLILLFSYGEVHAAPRGGKRGMKRGAAFKAPVRKPKVAARKPPMKRAKSMTAPKSVAAPAKPALKRSNSMASMKPAAAPAPAKPGIKRANSMPAVKPAPHSYVASNTQFTNITSQKIGEKGKPNGPQRPIVYSNPQNRIGQQKTYYRGVKNIKGFAGSSDAYVDDVFKNGMKSNYQINKNVPGVRSMKEPPKTNVWAHQNKTARNSIFVATSKDKKVSQGFAGKGEGDGVFVVRPKTTKPINVNKTVPKEEGSGFRHEKEYVFANEIPGKDISHFLKNGPNGKVEKIKNPNYNK